MGRNTNAAQQPEAEKPVDDSAPESDQQQAAEADSAPDGAEPEQPAADDASDASGSDAEAEAAEEGPSLEEQLAELGLEPDSDGLFTLELLVGLSGATAKAPGAEHRCDGPEAVRMVRAAFARAK